MKNNVRFKMIGDMDRLPEIVQEKIKELEDHTAGNTAMTAVIALSYSSRWELVKATKQIAQGVSEGKYKLDDITEAFVSQHLETQFMPDPDLLIRTGASHLQLSAVADRLFRTIFLRHLLARLQRGRAL